jgi:chemotaxis protein methyltransferase CheR
LAGGRSSDISNLSNLPREDSWAFEALKELLMREKGFDLEAYKERCILRRIYLKVRSKGFSNLGLYFRALSRNMEELEELFQYLTINVTEFFRNPSAYQYLQEKIIPVLLNGHDGNGAINIWSAGCSSGEEPYSLAIMMLKAGREVPTDVPFRVLATDVDKSVLAKGKEGFYTEEALKNIDEEDVHAYFDPDKKGYRVKDSIKRRVTFKVANILTDRPGGRQDLIVCRNLLIYFSRDNQEKIIANFSREMKPGGYLMLGKAETLIGRSRLFFLNVSPVERIYRKRDVPLEDYDPVPQI